MNQLGYVAGVRRTYNQWVANETLEDFALRFTARRARKRSAWWVANTAIGSISFLALEAIGGAVTLAYGFDNALAAILLAGAILFLTGLPISYHAAKAGVDIDLLTRGAGFGYLGSTITSLIYAGFTFIFFAVEAAILSKALEMFFGLPIVFGYLLNALLVIPLVTHGFSRIGIFQMWTQPIWLGLHLVPFLALAVIGTDLAPWTSHIGRLSDGADGFDIVLIASATGIVLSLSAQIGEQVDFLRFLPEPKSPGQRRFWWVALIVSGPGWAVIGTIKMLLGSFLAVLVLESGAPAEEAVEPTRMYLAAFESVYSPEGAMVAAAVFVILSQLKINVTNAYAGSIAWSNFFSRLTHHHPGRVVWLVFNVAIALLLMEFGIFGALEHTLAVYSHVALAWIGAVTADLLINLQFGLRPKKIEFRRGGLFDINPVGTGAMGLATLFSFMLWFGIFGETAAAFSSLSALGTAFVAAPVIAWATSGRYYIARDLDEPTKTTCTICQNHFDEEDMLYCPFHQGTICSLCCSLEARCNDMCKRDLRIEDPKPTLVRRLLPSSVANLQLHAFWSFLLFFSVFVVIVGAILLVVYQSLAAAIPDAASSVGHALTLAFGLLAVLVGVVAWLYALSNESRDMAHTERELHNHRLMDEIRAHEVTDAELQKAKEVAEAANEAKSRYLLGITHELRTPLNAILGYAQLLETDPTLPDHRHGAVRVIRRSSEHLADLIAGLLDVSKIEAGRLDVERQEVNLREMLEQLCAVFTMEAGEKGLNFVVELDEAIPPFIFGDEKRLRQILINLLSNAVRYTDQGEVRFDVSFRSDTARFVIEDTGRGIPLALQERVFAPFERIQDPENPVQGTGLGLTITKLLVEILGGELTLDSAPGKGSRFEVILYLSRSDRTKDEQSAPSRSGYTGRRQHILICDDNLAHRRLMEDALGPLGFELSMAETGEIALDFCRANPPDIALVDQAMPGLSGSETCQQIRRDLGLTIPLVIVSADADPTPGSGGPDQCHDDFLSKPVNVDLMLETIGQHLDLTWEYGSADLGSQARHDLPHAAASELVDALAIGHMATIRKTIDRLGRDPITAEFAARARPMVDSFDLPGLRRLIEEGKHVD